MTERETIIERCRKILALAQDRASSAAEAEAESAAGLLAKLMTRHSLSMADLAAGTYAEGFAAKRVTLNYARIPKWVANLSACVAKPLDCRAMAERSAGWHDVGVVFLGRSSDAQVAAYLFAWLHGLLPRAAAGQRVPCRHPSRWRESFLIAAALAIKERMTDEKARAMREAAEAARSPQQREPSAGPLFERQLQSTCADLARVKGNGLDRLIKDRIPDVKEKTVKSPPMDMEGFMAGTAYGERLPLKKGIEARA